MGGNSYDRAIPSTSSAPYSAPVSNTSSAPTYVPTTSAPRQRAAPKLFSDEATAMVLKNLERKNLHPDVLPSNTIECKEGIPVVMALDVTGSMGVWLKVFLDKLPMFYGQMLMNGMPENPALSFCVYGDALHDQEHPLQAFTFSQGNALDAQMEKFWLTHHGVLTGGGNGLESANLAAYYYLKKCNVPDGEKGFFFMTGDEPTYDEVALDQIQRHIDPDCKEPMDTWEVFSQLKEKFHVFFLLKKCDTRRYLRNNPDYNEECKAFWTMLLGEECVIPLENPKAVVDTCLGAIALTLDMQTLDEYIDGLSDRGQDSTRCSQVREALANSIVAGKAKFADVEDVC